MCAHTTCVRDVINHCVVVIGIVMKECKALDASGERKVHYLLGRAMPPADV